MNSGDDKDLKLDTLRQQALGWVQHLTSGQATRADADALKHWLEQSADHETAFGEASGLWKNIGPAGHNLRVRGQAAAELAPSRQVMGRRAVLAGGLAAASAAGAYAIIRPPFGLWPSWAEFTADYRTETGEQRDLDLDHVAIRLNTQTSLSVRPPVGDSDQVRLISGEASFATASKSIRSLVVLAADGKAIAQNARFDVRHIGANDGASICVVCLAGSVRVEHRGGTATIGPGQQLSYDANRLGLAASVDPAIATAWQHGILVFRFTPLAEVIDEINRYRPGRVILLNHALGQSPVSGRFRIDHMDEIFVRIEEAFGARVRALPGGFVLLS